MKGFKLITIEGEPNPEDKKILIEGLLSHHKSQGHPRKSKLFSILLKDDNKKVFGGIIVSFLWNGMEIQSLWVDESIRELDWGTNLIKAVEKEAVKRGCTLAYTNTFSWQASEFYIKFGYSLYGKLDNFPEGNSLSYFYKKLT